MQNLLSLNDLYTDYTDGVMSRREFEGSVSDTIRNNIHVFGLTGWTREDYDDYISSIYPRISKAIDVYRETGSSFENYIVTLVRLTAKEFHSRQVRTYMEETAAWIAHLPDIYACESEPSYDDCVGEDTEAMPALNNPRQLLILILKCCNHISMDFLEKVSPHLGIKSDELCGMIDSLKKLREKREWDIISLRERINRQFYRCILFEKKLKLLPKDGLNAQRVRKQLEQGRSRLSRSRDRLARTRHDPSNDQIAKILGISKATVDTALYSLRRRAAALPVK